MTHRDQIAAVIKRCARSFVHSFACRAHVLLLCALLSLPCPCRVQSTTLVMSGDHTSGGVIPAHGAIGGESPGQQARCVTARPVDGSSSSRPEATDPDFTVERALITKSLSLGATGRVRLSGKVSPNEATQLAFGKAMTNLSKKIEMSAEGNDLELAEAYPLDPSLSRAPAHGGPARSV